MRKKSILLLLGTYVEIRFFLSRLLYRGKIGMILHILLSERQCQMEIFCHLSRNDLGQRVFSVLFSFNNFVVVNAQTRE